MFPLTVAVKSDEFKNYFVEKELFDSRLTFHVVFKRLQHSTKVIFFFLIRPYKLKRFYVTNLKLIQNNTRSTQGLDIRHPNEFKATQTKLIDEKIQFRKNAFFHFICNIPDNSMTITLESIIVKDNFNMVLTGLGFNYPIPDKDNHDITLICNRHESQGPQPNGSNENLNDLDNNVVYAHKHILAYHSTLFRQKFQGKSMYEKLTNIEASSASSSSQTKKEPNLMQIKFEKCSYDVIQFIVDFMYTGTVNPSDIVKNSSTFWMEVLNFSVEWKITELQPLALLICFSLISTTNSHQILQLGLEIENVPDITSHIMKFVTSFNDR